jgi:hypothetical protein
MEYYTYSQAGGKSSYSEWYKTTYYSEWYSMYGSLKPESGGGGGASNMVGGSAGGNPGYSEWSEYKAGGGSWSYAEVRSFECTLRA